MSDLFKEKKEPVKKKTIIIKYPQLANPVKIAIDIVDKRDTIINRTEILKKIGIKEKIQQPEQQEQQEQQEEPSVPEPLAPEPLAPQPLTSKKKPLELKTVKKPKTEKQQEIIPNPDLDIIEPGKMKIINTYEEALEIGKKYIAKATASKVFDFNKSNINSLDIPPQIANPIWQMTAQALTNTLDYLFKKLHHSFYMLCIMDNNFVLYKVEMTTAAPTFINAIKTIHLPALEENTLITDAQKKYIKRELKKPARILQCIFKEQYKPITEETRYVEENLYVNIVKNMKLPNGVFILNLTDAIILKANGREPFPMVTGDLPLNEFNFTEHIPILTMSGQNNYLDIPIPNYDDIDFSKKKDNELFNTIWKEKKTKAVFRGGAGGCGYTAETNQRLKLVTFKNDLLDVGLTTKNKTIDSKSIKFDPIYGIGMLNTNIKSANFITIQEQSNYKYIIHVDGNIQAYRLLTTMRTGSLILRVKSEYISWVDHLIKPNVHYILINADLSNLEERLQWCIQNDKKCETIAKNSLEFSTTILDETIIKKYFQKILWSLSKYDSNVSLKTIQPKPAATPAAASTLKVVLPEQTQEEIQIELITQKANVDQLTARLPNTKAINIKSSQYYLNNREYFINFINRLLEPYKRKILANVDEYKCDKSGDDSFSLLTHQMIVRDYINLITPYRGLLLYHGLGSGKTCSSIAIVEGIKTEKQVMIMLPKSLEENYKQELKKCGDILYRNNQYWEFISIKTNPKLTDALASVLSLSPKIIEKNGGAWFIDKNKTSNYSTLSSSEQKILNDQIDAMLNNKYVFVRYNGLREKKFDEMVAVAKGNPFSNKVIVIDEAHNFVSRIVNQIKRPNSLAMKIYNYLQSAENTKIILLTGTPIINYPHEVAIMMNILRGNINTWQLKLINEGKFKLTENSLAKLFASKLESNIDYLRFKATPEPILTITRNPYGFFSVIDKNKNYSGVELNESGNISDTDFIEVVRQILLEENIKTEDSLISFKANKCLPDNKDEFNKYFLETSKKGDPITLKNMDLFKRRILGLVSYFPDIDALLPKYNKNDDFHIILVPMSKFQFDEYEKARAEERKLELNNSKKNALKGAGDLFESSSTYRIFSRAFCNFVFPAPEIIRPLPRDGKSIGDVITDDTNEDLVDAILVPNDIEQQEAQEGPEGQESQRIKSEISSYASRIIKALDTLDKRRDEFLTPEKLNIYSPKFLNILTRLLDDTYEGTHLIYSQFRTLEGIGILSLVLKANGFAQFKIVKLQGEWRLNIKEEDIAKPKYILYTGTEQPEEKEILRNIFNSNWDALDATNTTTLKEEILQLNGGEIGDKNIYGAVIKIIMITASGAEGISLSNVRYVHITEPYWHPVRNDQVIGRARRICSHKSLPQEKQTVEVFLYLMDLTKELVDNASKELKKQDKSKLDKTRYMLYKTTEDPYLTSDQSLYEISKQKENVTQEILKNMKESSIDCNLHNAVGSSSELQCLSFGSTNTNKYIYTPAIETDDKDDAKKLNKQAKKIEIKPILITNKDGTKIECGYNILDLIQSNEDANKIVSTTLYTLDSIKLKNPVIIGTISFKNTAPPDEAPIYEKYQVTIK